MWSQPLIPSPKKPSPAIYTIPIPSWAHAPWRIWMVFPLACCPLALRWLPGCRRLWLVLHGLPRWRQNFQRRHLCRWRTGPKGRMGMGWYGLTWERGSLKHLEKNQCGGGLLFNFWSWKDVISVQVYICIHDDLMDKWTRFNNSCLSLPQALKITSWNKQSWMFGGISDGFSFKFRTALNQ